MLGHMPALRRFFSQGFQHVPEKDAPDFGLVCLENSQQRLYVDPENGNCRVGANFHFGARRNG